MIAPAIIIGLGTTGKETVEFLQMMLYAKHRGQLSDLNRVLRLIVIDTQEENRVSWLPIPENIISYIPLTTRNELSEVRKAINQPSWWHPDAAKGVKVIEAGALQNRPNARGTLWVQFTPIQQKIKEAFEDLKTVMEDPAPHRDLLARLRIQGLGNSVNVFLVGSLTGGTCSGTFMDIAHYLYTMTTVRPQALLYIPPIQFPSTVTNIDIPGATECAWAALGDLLYYLGDGKSLVEDDIPPIPHISWKRNGPIFEKVGLISPRYVNGTFPDIATLEKVGAFYLYLCLCVEIQGSMGASLPGVYTFGISGNYAPVFEVASYAAIKRLLESVALVTAEHGQGEKPSREASSFLREFVVKVIEKVKENVGVAAIPKAGADLERRLNEIENGLAKNQSAAAALARELLEKKSVAILKETSNGNFDFLFDFLGNLASKLSDTIRLCPTSRPAPHLDEWGNEWLYGFSYWNIKSDRWEDLVEGLVLCKSRQLLEGIQVEVVEFKSRVMDLMRAFKDCKQDMENWQRQLSTPLNAAGLQAQYLENNLEGDANRALRVFGLIPLNPLTDEKALGLSDATLSKLVSAAALQVRGQVSGVLRNGVQRLLQNLLYQKNEYQLLQSSPPRESYLEFRPDFPVAGIETDYPKEIDTTTEAFPFRLRIKLYNLDPSSGTWSKKLAFSSLVKSGTLGKDVLVKRCCTTLWQQQLTLVCHFASYVMFDWFNTAGRWAVVGPRSGCQRFDFDGRSLSVKLGAQWFKFDELTHLDLPNLDQTIREEVTSMGLKVEEILAARYNDGVLDRSQLDMMSATWEKTREGAILW